MPVSEPLSSSSEWDAPSFKPRLLGIILLMALIIGGGLWLVSRFVQQDLTRDIQGWQEKLNLIAESRSVEITNFISGHFKDLHTLADNPSLQLYLTKLEMIPGEVAGEGAASDPAEKVYLRNLLLYTAERSGFVVPNQISSIRANVQLESKFGLAVLNRNQEILVSTLLTEQTRQLIQQHAKNAALSEDTLIDIQKDADGDVAIGFIVPIYAIQGNRDAESQIGTLVGIKQANDNLFGLLKHPGITERTLETILLRSNGEVIDYLSTLQDGSAPLSKQSLISDDTTETQLVKAHGSYVTEKKDYRGMPVLATSRKISATPWMMVVKIDRAEALASGEQRRASMVTFFIMLITSIALIIIAVWRYAHSKRATFMSYHFRRIAVKARAQERLLRVVSDNQPEAIFILDEKNIFHFANRKAAEEAGTTPDFLFGKNLTDVRGAARAADVMPFVSKALERGDAVYHMRHAQAEGDEHFIRSAYIPLEHIPVAELEEPTPGVLVVEQDITHEMQERECRLKIQQQLVQTLIALVDKRDPFAANHSMLVAQVAEVIASEMALDDITVETTRIAASLMNVGKIVVSADLLTKTDHLSADEKRQIRESMYASADVIKNISFNGPVVETLKQWQEHWDGSGVLGLKGDAILISARIILVANAFVGMISPRSWRTALGIDAANKFLLDQCETHFDRRVVVALINYIDNHQGKQWLQGLLDKNKSAA